MNPAPKTAFLLITHGSRDPRSQAGADKLAEQLRERFGLLQPPQSFPLHRSETESIAAIATAVLELGPAPLHLQIQQFAQEISSLGVTQLKLLPLFLLPGVHVRQDLPEELAQAQTNLARNRETATISLELLPHLGADDALVPVLRAQQQALLTQFSQEQLDSQVQRFSSPASQPKPVLVGRGATSGSASATLERQTQKHLSPLTLADVDWVVVAHGSRRPAAVAAIAALAESIDAQAAYWVGSPSVTDYVEARCEADESASRPLGLLSYFLFEGGITDRLEAQLEEVQAELARNSTTDSAASASFSQPLSAFDAWVDVVAEAIERSR